MYLTKNLEKWGTGTNRIIDLCREQNVAEPAWLAENGTVCITFKRPQIGASGNIKQIKNVGDMSEINVGDKQNNKLTERQQIIISIIRTNPFASARQMSETLSVTSRTIERDLAAMQKIGIIKHEGQDNAGKWIVLK